MSFYRPITWILIGVLMSSLAVPIAQAAYDRPVSWSDMSTLDLSRVFKTRYASNSNLLEPVLPDSALDLVLRDADGRVGPEFKIPDALKGPVSFWLRIYTEYTTQHLVLFDETHPEVVYEVLDFRELYKKSRNLAAFEIVMKLRVKKKMALYRAAFKNLARGIKGKNTAEAESRIIKALAHLDHKHPYATLSKNLRTQTGQRDNLIKGLLAAETFFPKMEEIFRQVGAPIELTRLALVESSFDLSAVSRTGASGVWQFMPATANTYMIVNSPENIDERLSPLKATVAAARLLKVNRSGLGNWPLAVTAYNHGMSGLTHLNKKARLAAERGEGFSSCNKKGRLGFAGRNYFSEFLAVLHAEAYRDVFYGESPLPVGSPIVYRQVKKNQTGATIAKEENLSAQEFQFYNPDIQNLKAVLPHGFFVALPGHRDDLLGMIQQISPANSRITRVREISMARPRK